MVDEFRVLEKLILYGGALSKQSFQEALYNVLGKLELRKVEVKDKDFYIREYLKRKYKVGGRRLQEYTLVARDIRGIEGKLKKVLGEVENEE
jgi:hypothetical protein